MLKVTPRLGELLKEKGYTSQSSFCNEHNFPQKTINSFDKSVQHKSVNLFAIARALNVNVEELFKVEEIPDEETTE